MKNVESFVKGEHILVKSLAAVHNNVGSIVEWGHYLHQHKYGTPLISLWARGGLVVEALRYKPEGCGIDSQWNFSLT
jgi:hypothetical protein